MFFLLLAFSIWFISALIFLVSFLLFTLALVSPFFSSVLGVTEGIACWEGCYCNSQGSNSRYSLFLSLPGLSSPRRNTSFDPLDMSVSPGIPTEVRKSGSELGEGLSSEVRETAVI